MKTRIGILGLGGVGGFFGGSLAKAYFESDSVEIIFIARGETKESIAKNGLKLKSDTAEQLVFPTTVANDAEIIGILDYLICATKTYDIEESLGAIKSCITDNTVILPLYNGVDSQVRIQVLFPNNEVLLGCVYIVSMIESPGVIKKIGSYQKLYFGSKNASQTKLTELLLIFQKADFESYLVDNIEETVWEKFIFISALASATSYLNQNIGQILGNKQSSAFYQSLVEEVVQLALAKGLSLPEDIIKNTISKLEKTPANATSSMHRDIIAGRNSEILSLTAYVVNEATTLNIATPYYKKVWDKLSVKSE